jgi:hypothetical protein
MGMAAGASAGRFRSHHMPDNRCPRTAVPAFHVFTDVLEATVCFISIMQPVRRNTPCLPASDALRINGIACLNIGQPNGIARAEDNAIVRHAWSNAGTLIESPSDLTSRPRVFSNRLYSGLCTAEWARDRAPVLHCGVLLRAVWRPSAQALRSTGWAGSGPSLRFAPMTAVRTWTKPLSRYWRLWRMMRADRNAAIL